MTATSLQNYLLLQPLFSNSGTIKSAKGRHLVFQKTEVSCIVGSELVGLVRQMRRRDRRTRELSCNLMHVYAPGPSSVGQLNRLEPLRVNQ